MRILSFLIIIAWSLFTLIKYPDLKPSDNLFFYLLSVVSIMYSIVSIIILISERKR